MPLRTLLGYEPKSVRPRQDYGGQFISFTPARSVMATKKQKYQAPMARVKKLPPIDEESGTPMRTPQVQQHVSVRRVPKSTFHEEDEYTPRFSHATSKPVLPVQPIPREKVESPPPLKNYIFESNKSEVQMPQKLSPKDVNHTLVDGLVADYLHYARYGHVIPVYEGTSATTCPCCTDRNRQNVRTLLGFPKNVAIESPPTKYDHKSSIKNTKKEEELGNDSTMYPNSLYAQMQRQKAQRKEPTPEEKRLKKLAEESHKQSWMNYQPLPYATNYLNPEFNRPSELKSLLYESDPYSSNMQMRHRVLQADSNFDSAMNKLSGYTYGGNQI